MFLFLRWLGWWGTRGGRVDWIDGFSGALFDAPEIRKHFPRRAEIEFSELLGQFQRFTNDAFDLVVIPDLYEAGQREVLSERMPRKAVVSENSPQIGMVRKEHTEHVPYLAFIPVGTLEQPRDRVNRGQLIRIGLNCHSFVMFQRQKHVNKLFGLKFVVININQKLRLSIEFLKI